MRTTSDMTTRWGNVRAWLQGHTRIQTLQSVVLPAAPLAGLFRAAVGQAELLGAHAVILIGWALLIPPLAVRFFTWEER